MYKKDSCYKLQFLECLYLCSISNITSLSPFSNLIFSSFSLEANFSCSKFKTFVATAVYENLTQLVLVQPLFQFFAVSFQFSSLEVQFSFLLSQLNTQLFFFHFFFKLLVFLLFVLLFSLLIAVLCCVLLEV